METNRAKLAEKVLSWARDELKLTKDAPLPTDVQKLCVGNMIHVWNFLLQHVRSDRNDKQGGAERQEQERELKKLQEQKELLLASLAEARSQLAKVEIDLERTKTDLETEVSIDQLRYCSRIQQQEKGIPIPNGGDSSESKQMFSINDTFDSLPNRPVVVSYSVHVYGEICGQVKKLYNSMTPQQEMQKIIISKLEESKLPPNMLSAVGSLSDTSRITISMQTNALSRPSYNRGASVASSLYKLRADSTDRFLYTLQDMMHTKQTEALLNNSRTRRMIPELQQLRTELCTLSGLRSVIATVEATIYNAQQNNQTGEARLKLKSAKVKLQSQKETRNNLKGDVDFVLKSNLKMIARITNNTQTLSSMIVEQILKSAGILATLCSLFGQLAPLIAELFDKSPLPSESPFSSAFHYPLPPILPQWREGLRQLLGLPRCHAPEFLLSRLIKEKETLEVTKSMEQFEAQIIKAATLHTTVKISPMELERADTIRVQEEQQLARAQHIVCSEAEKDIHASSQISGLAEDWWNQPAQFTVPWVKVDSRSLHDWIQEWRRLCALLSPQ